MSLYTIASAKPVSVFVPGAKVTQVEVSIGHLLDSFHSLKQFDPDVDNVRNVVEDVLSSAQDVVIVAHSYGGLPASEAIKYFMDGNEGMKGKGRILRVVWVCAFVGVVGDSLHESIGGKDRDWFRVSNGSVSCSEAKRIFYNDMSDDEAEQYINSLQPHAYSTFFSRLSVEPWTTVPSTYVICESDQAIPAHAQEHMKASTIGLWEWFSDLRCLGIEGPVFPYEVCIINIP